MLRQLLVSILVHRWINAILSDWAYFYYKLLSSVGITIRVTRVIE